MSASPMLATLLTPVIVIGLAFLGGCYPGVPPVETLDSTPSKVEMPIDPTTLMPPPDTTLDEMIEAFRAAYRQHGSPRLVILVNRPLESGEKAALRPYAKTRRVIQIEGRHVPVAQAPVPVNVELDPPGKEGQEQGTRTERVTHFGPPKEHKPSAGEQITYEKLEESVSWPFLNAGCAVVEPDVAERNARNAIARLGQQGTTAARAAAQLKALSQCADILIAIKAQNQIATVHCQTKQMLGLSAKAIDLHSARMLGRWYGYIEVTGFGGATSGSEQAPLQIRPEMLHHAGASLAVRLMDQMMRRWGDGELCTVAIHDLTSDVQLGHILDLIRSQQSARHAVVLAADIVPKGGRADVQVEFDGPPDELARALTSPTELPGFRLEVTGRRGAELAMKVVER